MVPMKYASTVYVPAGSGTAPSAALPWKSAMTDVANVCVLLCSIKKTDFPPRGCPDESRTTATNGVGWLVIALAEAGVTVSVVMSLLTVKSLVAFEPSY